MTEQWSLTETTRCLLQGVVRDASDAATANLYNQTEERIVLLRTRTEQVYRSVVEEEFKHLDMSRGSIEQELIASVGRRTLNESQLAQPDSPDADEALFYGMAARVHRQQYPTTSEGKRRPGALPSREPLPQTSRMLRWPVRGATTTAGRPGGYAHLWAWETVELVDQDYLFLKRILLVDILRQERGLMLRVKPGDLDLALLRNVLVQIRRERRITADAKTWRVEVDAGPSLAQRHWITGQASFEATLEEMVRAGKGFRFICIYSE